MNSIVATLFILLSKKVQEIFLLLLWLLGLFWRFCGMLVREPFILIVWCLLLSPYILILFGWLWRIFCGFGHSKLPHIREQIDFLRRCDIPPIIFIKSRVLFLFVRRREIEIESTMILYYPPEVPPNGFEDFFCSNGFSHIESVGFVCVLTAVSPPTFT